MSDQDDISRCTEAFMAATRALLAAMLVQVEAAASAAAQAKVDAAHAQMQAQVNAAFAALEASRQKMRIEILHSDYSRN